MSEHATVLYFANLRDKTGVKEEIIEFPHGSNIAALKAMVMEKYPALKLYKDTLIVAMNHEYASDELIISDGAEIAIFPPVSGGIKSEDKSKSYVAIVNDEIDVNSILSRLTLPVTGGVCTFTGTVRGITTRGTPHDTEHLVYQAYQEMAEKKMRQICEEIRVKWPEVDGIALVQRVGTLKQGDISVVVSCSASHRDTGIFDAARYGIDRLKEIVPVWKKEVSKDGEEWVVGEYLPNPGE